MYRDVQEVQCVGGARLRLTFEGGEVREPDISGVVDFHGVFSPLADAAYFRRVTVSREVGTIVRPNGADLCPDVLYRRNSAIVRATPRER